MGGCSGSECYENHSALPLAAFYSSETMKQVGIPQLAIYGLDSPNDSILYRPQTLNQAYLPFRIWQDSTQYVFAYYSLLNNPDDSDDSDNPDNPGNPDDSDNSDEPQEPQEPLYVPSDTITFRYNRKEWFDSPACGAMYLYEMTGVSHTDLFIDSIQYDDVITNVNAVNIKIFFHE